MRGYEELQCSARLEKNEMRRLIKEQSIILKMSWHLLISHQIMKYLFEPEAVVSFLVYSTEFIQQSFIECFSVPGPGLGAGDIQRNEPQLLFIETSMSPGKRCRMERVLQISWRRYGLSRAWRKGEGITQMERIFELVSSLCPGELALPRNEALLSWAGRCTGL